MFSGINALLLDMNSTFMFGEDRFGEQEDFSIRYFEIGGKLSRCEVNQIVHAAYEYLAIRYPEEEFRHNFPSLKEAIVEVAREPLNEAEIENIARTFAFHELGFIPQEYAAALNLLRERFTLAVVADIWSPKQAWLAEFERAGISRLFSASSFSSDHGIVKPSPMPFETVITQLGVSREEVIVVGDSPRRDLGGAQRAGIECILVGGAKHPDALKRKVTRVRSFNATLL